MSLNLHFLIFDLPKLSKFEETLGKISHTQKKKNNKKTLFSDLIYFGRLCYLQEYMELIQNLNGFNG
jgi:hypothetical protein